MSNVPENITLAIEKSAENAGRCVYHNDGPSCIIAHLGQIHGLDSSSWTENHGVREDGNAVLAKEFLPYPKDSLNQLQEVFDTCTCESTSESILKKFAASLDWE